MWTEQIFVDLSCIRIKSDIANVKLGKVPQYMFLLTVRGHMTDFPFIFTKQTISVTSCRALSE